ncbi:hypothetical protein JM18_006841 [Phytophthora kernoviae]|uniref:Uncharacterized protein n=1 Tax=Phytophthora kernoviae TaxID=325452 RepID=A0A921SEK6_9STRA|nr:hypothetical protein JM18_006841 [Phytophthora kernoviae]
MAVDGSTLVIFDFDQSLINEDSDDFVFRSFHPELATTLEARFEQKRVWPTVFDDMLQVIAREKPHVTTDMIWEKLEQIPMQPRMTEAIRMAVDQFGADFKVISDGNTFYINGVLQHRELDQHSSGVFANPAEFEVLKDGRKWIRIRPYHTEDDEPLGCEWCPSNMCKGRILESLRKGKQYARVIYVGDGVGDFCPATRLTTNDVVCARADKPDRTSYGLQKRIDKNAELVKATVVPWSTGDDIYRVFTQFFNASPQN